MTDSQKLVLMVQPTRLQGLIWHAVLKSQRFAVIWEAADFDIAENLHQLAIAGLPLPNLLLVDVRLKDFNPYAFCRWCRGEYPDVKIILTNVAQREIEPSERQWAMHQGAADLMPGFRRDNLVTSVTTGVKRLLQVLDDQPLDNGALIAVLFAMKRELEARQAQQEQRTENGAAPVSTSTPPSSTPQPVSLEPYKNGQSEPSDNSPPLEDVTIGEPVDETSDQPPRRRYRGIKY